MDYLTVQNDFLVPVGQFLKTDFPEISFPSGSDVLQILWCPRYHTHPNGDIRMLGPNVKAFWHSTISLQRMTNPKPNCPDPTLVPEQCVLDPMRVADVPGFAVWTRAQKKKFDEIESFSPNADGHTAIKIPAQQVQVPGTK